MPRDPTLLSLTFESQDRPVKILKNFIFLVIHDTKAVPYSSGNPGWQNSTKTHFPEQKKKINISVFTIYIDWAILEEANCPLPTITEDSLISLYRSSYFFFFAEEIYSIQRIRENQALLN